MNRDWLEEFFIIRVIKYLRVIGTVNTYISQE